MPVWCAEFTMFSIQEFELDKNQWFLLSNMGRWAIECQPRFIRADFDASPTKFQIAKKFGVKEGVYCRIGPMSDGQQRKTFFRLLFVPGATMDEFRGLIIEVVGLINMRIAKEFLASALKNYEVFDSLNGQQIMKVVTEVAQEFIVSSTHSE
jgi:hypothetical protein